MRLVRAEEARRSPENYREGYPLMETIGEDAWLTDEDLRRLPEYSASQPTGVCEGKVWKHRTGDGWLLGAYEPCDPPEPDMVLTVYRRIHVLTPREAQVRRVLAEMAA